MFRASIKRENKLTNQAQFSTMEELNSWLEREIANGSFGKSAHEEIIFDETGKELEVIQHPAEYTIEIEDISAQHAQEELKKEMLQKGALARKVCQDCLDIIAGFNIDRTLTAEQITQMQQTFGTIETLLRANRPASAKPLITALVPDGVLVTEQMKETVLAVLNEV